MKPSDDTLMESGADAWLSVCDNLLWGFNHALSNRLAAISSIARILEHSDTGLDPLLSVLSEEIATLEETLKLLRLVPGNPHGAPEPVLLEDLLPEVVRLHEVRGDVSDLGFDLRFDGDAQPVWVEPARLAHAVLIALGAASRVALASGKSKVQLAVESAPQSVSVSVTLAGGDDGARLGTFLAEEEAETVNRLMSGTGGVVSETGDGGQGIELRIPTLLEVRARERDG